MRFLNNLILPKNVKGDPSGFCNIQSVAKYQKNEWGPDPLETLKTFEKKLHSVEKKSKRGILVSSGLVCYAEKRKTIMVQFPGSDGTI